MLVLLGPRKVATAFQRGVSATRQNRAQVRCCRRRWCCWAPRQVTTAFAVCQCHTPVSCSCSLLLGRHWIGHPGSSILFSACQSHLPVSGLGFHCCWGCAVVATHSVSTFLTVVCYTAASCLRAVAVNRSIGLYSLCQVAMLLFHCVSLDLVAGWYDP